MKHELIKYFYSHSCVSIFELVFTEVPKSFFTTYKIVWHFQTVLFQIHREKALLIIMMITIVIPTKNRTNL